MAVFNLQGHQFSHFFANLSRKMLFSHRKKTIKLFFILFFQISSIIRALGKNKVKKNTENRIFEIKRLKETLAEHIQEK